MKWLITYAVSINGNSPRICNAILPDVITPMNWIAEMNQDEKDNMTNIRERPVLREYALISYWHVSDNDALKWVDDGTGYLTLADNQSKVTD
jgi:hypothetical protein